MIDRTRVTDRVNVQTLRLELRRALQPLIMLAVGFAVAIVAGYYIVQSINGGIGSTHQMRFEVADATGVVPGRAEVRFYGIHAGQISGAKVAHGRAIITVNVADKFGPVFRDATAAVRPNTALQDMYLDITSRGTRSAGVAGPNYVIPIDQTHSPSNLADVLNTFQPDVRTRMYDLIDQLGNGLADRGADLRQAFVLLAPFLRIAGNVSQQLAARTSLTKQLVHNTAQLSNVLASRSTELRQLVTQGTATLGALSTEGGAALRADIAQLPGMLHVTQTILNSADGLFPALDKTIGVLEPVANELPSGLTNLQNLAASANPAVVRLQRPVQQLVPLADQLQPFAANLAGALRQIRPQISTVDTATTDLADCTTELNEFFNWDASMSKWVDQQGPMVRGNGNFGFYTVPTVKDRQYGYRKQCAPGAPPLGEEPTPKFNGPAPAP